MSDPSRTESSREPEVGSGPDREAKIEQLLLDGLDHYFAGRYQQAVNVWTRVLFLDRSHARARAYIERARSALAERQRQSEELLQTGVAAFERGEGGEARRLLHAAIEGGAPSDEALAVLDRLDRLETSAADGPPARAARDHFRDARGPAGVRRLSTLAPWLAGAAVVLVAGFFGAGVWGRWQAGRAESPAVQGSSLAPEEGLAPPTRGERALARARTLVASGRLVDALSALDRIRPTDPEKADGDQLRAEIQRRLLAPPAGAPASGAARGERRTP